MISIKSVSLKKILPEFCVYRKDYFFFEFRIKEIPNKRLVTKLGPKLHNFF